MQPKQQEDTKKPGEEDGTPKKPNESAPKHRKSHSVLPGTSKMFQDLSDKQIFEEEKLRRLNTEDDLPKPVRRYSLDLKR